ncbi:hypothetical protein [uncultured Microbacterium sp.]|uniref:hypothetical protein n=1 Tax=uncultured Microbacterium sp. TaxID=191216 RepID=UPI0025E3705F|nr:hypothetical protein [uncultured Microbacterium sp.]
MPTTRPRTQVTHTDEVEEALRIARSRWPDESPSALIAHLVVAGAHALRVEEGQRDDARSRRIDVAIGRFAGIYGPGYLPDLRADWPE